MALAQARKIDAIIVSELSRWVLSTPNILITLEELRTRKVSLLAQSGLEFDLTSPQGNLIATLLAGLAEFERDLIRERVRSGMTAAKSRGQREIWQTTGVHSSSSPRERIKGVGANTARNLLPESSRGTGAFKKHRDENCARVTTSAAE